MWSHDNLVSVRIIRVVIFEDGSKLLLNYEQIMHVFRQNMHFCKGLLLGWYNNVKGEII